MRIHSKYCLLLLWVALLLPTLANAQGGLPDLAEMASVQNNSQTTLGLWDLPDPSKGGNEMLPPLSNKPGFGATAAGRAAPTVGKDGTILPRSEPAEKARAARSAKVKPKQSIGGPKYRTDRILVKPKKGAKASAVAGLHASLKSKVRRVFKEVQGLQVVELPPGADVRDYIGRYEKSNLVEYASPDYIRQPDHNCPNETIPNEPWFPELYGLHNEGQMLPALGQSGTFGADVNAACAWGIRHDATMPDGSDVIVSVIDTGVMYTHEDLTANMWTNPVEQPGDANSDGFPGVMGVDDDDDGLIDEDSAGRQPSDPGYNNDLMDDDDENGYIDDIYGINAIEDYTNVIFGTPQPKGDPMDDLGHGTHVSGTIGAVGNNGIGVAGVCWRVKLMACKFIGPEGGSDSDAIECMTYSWKNGAKIMSCSWGGTEFSEPLRDAIQEARDHGVLFIAAAGNDYMDNDLNPHYPASFDVDQYGNLLDNIVSVACTDWNDNVSEFSDIGLNSVDIAAPGDVILSTLVGDVGQVDYWYMSGTSMATPHVSGALALMRAQFPNDSYQRLVARMYNSADRIPSLANKCTTGGRVNLYRAFTETPPDLAITTVDAQRFGGSVGGPYYPASRSFTLLNCGSATLDWTANTAPGAWINVSPSNGTLAPNASVVVTVTINANANSLGAGTHLSTISFVNTSTGSGTANRTVSLGLGAMHVKPTGNDANDGSSWTLAKKTLQGALDAVHPHQDIWMAGGVYPEHVKIKTDTAIYGGFAGTETSLAQRATFPRAHPDLNETVVDGEWNENHYQVFHVVCGNDAPNARIDGVTVTRSVGYAGIFLISSCATITNCTVKQSYGGGGAIYCVYSPAAKITNCLMTENGWSLGGIGCYGGSSPLIANNVFIGCSNTAIIMENDCSPQVVNNTVVGFDHAVILADHCSPIFANNLIAFNRSGWSVYQYDGHPCNPAFRNNCAFNRDVNYDGVPNPTGTYGNIAVDPQLASTQYGNLHIQAGSPCREGGGNDWVAPGALDMDGQNRIQGNYVDIGADETPGTTWSISPIVVRVSQAGNDANDGSSWSQAMRTVQGGLNRASAYGGEVWVQAGTYSESLYLPPFAYLYGGFAGTETSRDQRNWAANTTILDGESGYEVIRTLGGSYINWNGVDGFTLQNSGSGIYIYTACTPVANCVIKGNYWDGIGGRYAMSDITNNVIMGNGGYALGGFMRSMNVVGNTMVRNGEGVFCDGYSCPWIIANNIIAYNGSGLYAMRRDNPSQNPALTLSHNCVYGNGKYQYSQVTPDSGSISTDPKLAILNYGNMHIQANSPCKETGDDSYVAAGSRDMDWQARIQGSHVDIGADESDGTTWPTTPRIVRVTPDGNNANDGSTWTLAKATIQAGIDDAAKTGGEIWVKAGTYDEALNLKAFVSLYGGFAGTETSLSQRNWTTNVTTVDAQQQGSVVTILRGFKTAVVDGFTLQHGRADCGGGVYAISTCPTISHNVIKENVADLIEPYFFGCGGGMFIGMGAVITDNTIIDNVGYGPFYGGGGGGIILRGGVQTVTGNTITGNRQVSSVGNSVGGGIFATTSPWGLDSMSWYSYSDWGIDPYASTTITNNIITGNTTQLAGGGIFTASRKLTLTGNTISGNIVDGVDGKGGALYTQTGDSDFTGISMTIANNLVEDNEATSIGAAIYCQGGSIYRTFSDNRIINNTVPSGGKGGAFYLLRSSPRIVNNTIVGNQAVDGGAFYLNGMDAQHPSSPAVSNNVVASNSSGIAKEGYAVPVLRNNDFWSNGLYNYGPGLSAGQGDISADPVFVSGTDRHLASASPCINTGWDAAPGIPSTDMDGQPRINGVADMGADEYLILRVATTGSDANTGYDWAHPKQHIQAGVDTVTSGPADVWVKAGTYQENVTIQDKVQLYGGFAGSETTRTARDWTTNVSAIQPTAFGSAIYATGNETRDARVDGFTLTGSAGLQGGGIYCSSSSPTIANNKIVNNDCAWPASYIGSGGGIYCYYHSNPLIDSNAITDNRALFGGGIYTDETSAPVIVNNAIARNAAIYDGFEGGYGGWGGGIYCLGPAVITNNTITSNTMCTDYGRSGGGIYCTSSQATIANNIIAFNTDGISVPNGVVPILSHNDLYYNLHGNYSWWLPPGPGDISADPQLANRANGDLHIRPISPCRNAGDNLAAVLPTKDMDGQVRIEGTTVDIGADETYGEIFPTVALRVKADSPYDGPGNDWDHAFHTVGQAISYATIGDEVWVAAGTYQEPVCIPEGTSLYGGFAGTETLKDQRNWFQNASILDGGGWWPTVMIEYVQNARLDGFTVQNGIMADAFEGGGGVYCSGASAVITNNVITANSCPYPWGGGAGVYCENASALVTANVITDNSAMNGGGGILTNNSDVTISNNVITLNDAATGGGVQTKGTGSVTIVNNTISDNIVTGAGGGIDCYSSSPTIKNNIVAFNTSGISKSGTGSAPVLSYNDVFGNTAYQYGPGLSAGTGDISANPFFVDRPNDNYRLLGGSPCIDTATDTGAPTIDLDGLPRPLDGDGSGVAITDMGAYERPTDLAGAIRQCPNGNSISLRSLAVTAAFPALDPSGQNWVYVENADRTAGIRVKTSLLPAVSNLVNVAGTMQTDTSTGERYIDAASGQPETIAGTCAIDPLGTRNEWIGGKASGNAPLIKDGTGLYNVGMLVHTWGRVPSTGQGCFFLYDGSPVIESSGAWGIRVILPSGMTMPTCQSFLKVTGICGSMLINGQYVRVLRPRSAADVQTITSWTSGPVTLQSNVWNAFTTPGIPAYVGPESVFVGCPPGPGMELEGLLMRYRVPDQTWITYVTTPDSSVFGNCLVAEGYGLYIAPGDNTCYNFNRTPVTEDLLLSLTKGSSNGVNFSYLGNPFGSSIPWAACTVTNGTWTMPLQRAVSDGLVHKVCYWNGSSWQNVTDFATGSMVAGKAYQFYPKDSDIAIVVPEP